mgnify:FL=1
MQVNEINTIINNEFMGHKIDCIIIQPPLIYTPEATVIMDFMRDIALNNLNKEAKFFWSNNES